MAALLAGLLPASVCAAALSREQLAALPTIAVDPAAPLPQQEPPGRAERKAAPLHPRLSPQLDRLAWELARTSDPAVRQAIVGRNDARLREGRLQVVVQLRTAELRGAPGAAIRLGGVPLVVDTQVGGRLQGWVAPADLARLARADEVLRIETTIHPLPLEVISKGVKNMKADTVQALGVDGQGIVVGVLDAGFEGYQQLLGSELPAQVITKSFGTDITGGGEAHGTAVAELVHDVAPAATLVLVAYGSTLDFEDAVQWLVQNDVDIITTSTGSSLTGPCDGRDSMAAAANAAVDAGVIFLASAGNYGDGHYLGTFTPSAKPGFEGYHAFTAVRTVAFFGLGNNCYTLPAGMPLDVSLVWDDWGDDPAELLPRADYDLYLMRYDPEAGWQFTDVYSDYNQGQGGYPWEMIHMVTPSDGCYGLAIRQTAADHDHELHLYAYNMTFATPFQVPERSVIDPCVGEKVQCIGATTIYDTLAQYSSRGPANPDVTTGQALPKPDFTAPAGTKTVSLGSFSGTSASAPHAAGAMALLLQMTDHDPDLALAMARELVHDLGTAGFDDKFGWGRLELAACTGALCDDALACTTSACDPSVGCGQVAVTEGCLLDGACHAAGGANPADACLVCDPAAPGAWTVAPDGTPCDDGLACTTGDTCLAGTCVEGSPLPAGPLAAPCAVLTCDGLTGVAVTEPSPAGTACGPAPGCVDGRLTLAAACDGAGTCAGGGTSSCAPYALCADALTCAATCVTSADCVPLHLCVASACVPDQAPTADAGAPQHVAAGATVILDASGSTDPEGAPLSFSWSQTSGPTVALDDPSAATPVFTAPTPPSAQTLRFRLLAHDGHQASLPATTTVVVGPVPNEPPVADAGADLEVDEGAAVTLSGTGSSDPDNQALTYAWSQESGPPVELDDPTSKTPSFVAPLVDADSLVALALVVSDALVTSTPAQVAVLIRDVPDPEPLPEPTDVAEDRAVEATPEVGTDASPDTTTDAMAETGGDDLAAAGSRSACTLGERPAPATWAALLLALAPLFAASRRARSTRRS